jgi:chondroitin 4-sulfotransferase 11
LRLPWTPSDARPPRDAGGEPPEGKRMVISERNRCIFVHIQKTGGSSLEAVLRGNDPGIGSNLHEGRRHLFAREIRPLVGAERWNAYFKFAFVRNPWDRLVSWYHMCIQVPVPNAFARYVRACAPTFEAFVRQATTGMGERTTYNQLDYVTDERGEPMLDFVGRYETLHEDFARIRDRLPLAFDLPHVNRSEHLHYRECYSDATRDIVARRFARDIAYFGYDF